MESALHFLQAYYIYILGIISLGCLYLWDRFGTHMGRANDLLTKEDFREAIKEYDAAIASDPQDMHAFLGRAVAYEYLAEYEKAISDHTEALGLAKATGKAAKEIAVFHYYRGGTYLKAGQFQNAIDDFTATINLVPDYPAAYYQRGQAYKGLGNIQFFREDADRAEKMGYKPES